MVDCLGVAGEDEIEPTAATAAAGGDAEFLACDLQLLADFVELLCGKGAGADTGGVRFDDADDGGDAGGVQRETLDGTAQAGGRRSHEGVSSVVKIEQESVGAFNKGVGRVLVILEEGELVDDVGFEDLAEFLVL